MVYVWVFVLVSFFFYLKLFFIGAVLQTPDHLSGNDKSQERVFMALWINREDSGVGVRLIGELLLQPDWQFPVHISGVDLPHFRSSSAHQSPLKFNFQRSSETRDCCDAATDDGRSKAKCVSS